MLYIYAWNTDLHTGVVLGDDEVDARSKVSLDQDVNPSEIDLCILGHSADCVFVTDHLLE